ncbi:MAG: polysaccharide deacetylase family protein [Oscillospiraceae bacterium]|nr:polysaccharide deacetylase family protein [Oscillospiraceae bacterium]
MSRLIALVMALTLLFCTSCAGITAAAVLSNSPPPQPATVSSQQSEEPEIPDGSSASVEASSEAEPYVRVIDPTMPMVALTFDDGPHETCSDLILDVLEENHAVATFFEVGVNVWKYPQVLVREAELGCEIGSHSSFHHDLSKMDEDELLNDLYTVDLAFSAIGVPQPNLVRPPYGAVNDTVKTATGRSLVTWSIDTEDWLSLDAQKVISSVQNAGNLDGQVVLMHSLYESTAEAVQVLVPWLQEQGYQLVTVTELLSYYYGQTPQPNTLYGYSLFTSHIRTDTPLEPPSRYDT